MKRIISLGKKEKKKKESKQQQQKKIQGLFFFLPPPPLPTSQLLIYLSLSAAEGDTAGHARDPEVDAVGAEEPMKDAWRLKY